MTMVLMVAALTAAGRAQGLAVRASWGVGGRAPAVVRVGPVFRCAWSGGGGFSFGVWRGGLARGPVARAWRPVAFAPWTVAPWSFAPWTGTSPAPLGTTTLAGREVVPLIVPDPVSFREFTK